jgi:hypothetical protein
MPLVLAVGVCFLPFTAAPQNREPGDGERAMAAFATEWPGLHRQLIGLERAHGVFYGALVRERGSVDEAQVFRLMQQRIADGAGAASDPEAERGFAALGPRASAIVRRTHELHREVLSIVASVEPSARPGAIDAAVERYLSRPDVSLPDQPKDMTILYDHPYTSFIDDPVKPRREIRYPRPTGLVWASHWFQLAVYEPFERPANSTERRRGVEVVTDRFQRKLSPGQPPDGFPTELPLAPSIAPGLLSIHERAAAIFDNLNIMNDVLAEVLVHPQVGDVHAAIREAVEHFTDRRYRVADPGDWITMALRHSIFAQGGPALGVMTESDRNSSGHLQHTRRGGRAMPPGGVR